MKRHGNLWNSIIDYNNLFLAYKNARKGKSKYDEVKEFEKDIKNNLTKIRQSLIRGTFTTSEYKVEKKNDRGKERVLHKLPFYPDRIVHHALMNVIEDKLSEVFIKDTYQSIKGRGVHKASKRMKQFLKDKENTEYCLKMDIKKFYPSVDNSIMKSLVRKKIKCFRTLALIDGIIDSTTGLPIGNYTSQLFGNFYLAYFDHYIKQDLGHKYYVRYADDIVLLSPDKNKLHKDRKKIAKYLDKNLALSVKKNWQVFPSRVRGIDFLGFVPKDGHTLLRKSIKKRMKQATKTESLVSYYGWCSHANCHNLLMRTLPEKIDKIKAETLPKPLKRIQNEKNTSRLQAV